MQKYKKHIILSLFLSIVAVAGGIQLTPNPSSPTSISTSTGTITTLTGTTENYAVANEGFTDAGVLRVNGTATVNSGAAIGLITQTDDGQYFIKFSGTNYGMWKSGSSLLIDLAGSTPFTLTSGGNLTITGKVAPTNGTTCTLNAGSPSTCTATVTSGATCVANHIGTTAAAAIGVAVNVVTTTLTVTTANGTTGDIAIWCNK